MKQITSMWVGQLIIVRRYFRQDLICDLCEVPSAGSIFRQNNGPTSHHTEQNRHIDAIGFRCWRKQQRKPRETLFLLRWLKLILRLHFTTACCAAWQPNLICKSGLKRYFTFDTVKLSLSSFDFTIFYTKITKNIFRSIKRQRNFICRDARWLHWLTRFW